MMHSSPTLPNNKRKFASFKVLSILDLSLDLDDL